MSAYPIPQATRVDDGLPPHEPAAFNKEVTQALAHDMGVLLTCSTSMPRYALVELGQCEMTDREAIALGVQTHGLEVERLFDGTPESELADQGPWLIQFPVQPSGALLETLALHAGVHHALSMVASTLALDDLANHMRSWIEGLIPPDPTIDGDESCGAVLRWFDPRIGLDMPGCWPAADRLQFMQAFRWWAAWGADFSPRVMQGPGLNRAAPRAEPLPLDQALLLALDQLNTAETMLASVRENDIEPGELDHIAPALQRRLAHRLLDEAQRLGLGEWADQYMLLAMGLRLHPDIAEAQALQPILVAAATGEQGLGAAIADIDNAVWRDLVEEAPQVLALHSHALLEPLRQRRLAAVSAHPFHIPRTEVR
ncbi:DUF4123 domain-containing protein [Variovorax paradoxus]|uniref:DUF4123 domain-containing protein n=1 Tax=Variovorax paradoxus TaxID=34073 RepID=A0A5Q0M5U4_VARPD|nr:DUF4123 domain-containing protein [Variovorax paradoxus]QFZ84903.1 DUF4123 domain-containing protein [Variovorax paradoxus]